MMKKWIIFIFGFLCIKFSKSMLLNQLRFGIKMNESRLAARMCRVTCDDFKIREDTLLWINEWVIRKSLCPWALGVSTKDKLRLVVNDKSYAANHRSLASIRRNKAVTSSILNEVGALVEKSRNSQHETTFIILPSISNFLDFLELISDVEKALEQSGRSNDIQLASFHPKYRFEGSTETTVENYTNRSPYPMVHLLRVQQVKQAIEAVGGDTDFVWQNNIKKLQEMGLTNVLKEYEKMFPSKEDYKSP